MRKGKQMSSYKEIISEYNTVINILEQARLDLIKGTSGNKSASTRARRQLRFARNKTNRLIHMSLRDSDRQASGPNRHHFGDMVVDFI